MGEIRIGNQRALIYVESTSLMNYKRENRPLEAGGLSDSNHIVTMKEAEIFNDLNSPSLQPEKIIGIPNIHGCAHRGKVSTEYRSWQMMKSRCHNPKSDKYKYYGGRGIKVCERWRSSFLNFITDMGIKPSKSHTIDRVDNLLGYEPGNCRWATKREQCRNRRSCRLVQFNGRTMTVAELSEVSGMNYETLRDRILMGIPIEKALLASEAELRKIRKEMKCRD